MSTERSAVAAALTEAARTINQPRSVEETLDAIAEATMRTVPGFDHVGVSLMHRDGSFETKAGTDQLVWEFDGLQYSSDDGPCVEAMRGGTVVVVEEARHQQRWPRYIPAAIRKGLRSQLAIALQDEGRTVGGLNLYSTVADTLAEDAVEVAGMLAVHAAIALGRARESANLHEAISSRQLIGQAIGLIMQRYGLDETRAFDFLVRASATAEVKVRTIAQEIVDSANEKFRPGSQ
jgi:GAF domain-containing protein